MKKYAEDAKSLKEGDVVFTMADRRFDGAVVQGVLTVLGERFQSCELERSPAGAVALRLERKEQPCQ